MANPWVIAYAPDDGRELWRADCLGGEVGPSPVCFDGIVYASNETGGMSAIRVDGEGDVTDTHIDWMTNINVPDVSSPLITEEFVFLLKAGLLACFDRKGGEDPEPLWEEDLFEDVSSSPGLVGKRLYIFSDAGPAWILQPQEGQCERVGEFEMGEPCRTSPAFQPGRIYVRGDEHLFCIGQKSEEK
jgi:outer membrane protein assembly factor BamB